MGESADYVPNTCLLLADCESRAEADNYIKLDFYGLKSVMLVNPVVLRLFRGRLMNNMCVCV